MLEKKYDLLLLDAANSIIHKPTLWLSFIEVLNRYGIEVEESELRKRHKILSEVIHFPDRTDMDFYKKFNKEVLLSLGIVPTEQMLDDIFSACTYLPWESFEDAKALHQLKIELSVLSNFKNTLKRELNQLFGDIFTHIITSEESRMGKPNVMFYKKAIEVTGVSPNKILYVGDSIKLDVIPANSIGMDVLLIDRDNNFPYFNNRITSFEQLKSLFK